MRHLLEVCVTLCNKFFTMTKPHFLDGSVITSTFPTYLQYYLIIRISDTQSSTLGCTTLWLIYCNICIGLYSDLKQQLKPERFTRKQTNSLYIITNVLIANADALSYKNGQRDGQLPLCPL